MKLLTTGVIFLSFRVAAMAAESSPTSHGREPNNANPILPGYFADPSVLQTNGKTYLYATLDPWGDRTLGCWESDDLKSWTYRTLNWPTKEACTSPTSNKAAVWAPSVVQGRDRKFYMAISVGSEIWMGVSDHPLGPWKNSLQDRPLIPGDYRPGFHMIDAEFFVDDDGQIFLYWGSGWNWVNGRCFVSKLNKSMTGLEGDTIDITPSNYFEAPYVIKRHGKYFLMYSSGNTTKDTYQVHYAVADQPMGKFIEGANSPILSTSHERNVVSPGHHSVINRDGQDYIVYHRHSVPFDPNFVGRQVCVDLMTVKDVGVIENIMPTHQGPELFQRTRFPGAISIDPKRVNASSIASALNQPACVIDNNYATLWKSAADPKSNPAWLQIDLLETKAVTRHVIHLEYAWKQYRFSIEASEDGIRWRTVADNTTTPALGSPIEVEARTTARYYRLHFDSPSADTIGVWEWAVF